MADTTTPNNTANVSAAKGVKGGYFFAVDYSDANLATLKGATIKDFSKTIGTLFSDAVNLGFVSEDGWKVSEDRETEDFKDVNGDLVDSSLKSRTEKVTATLIEMKRDTLAEIYGSDNVTDTAGILTALHTSDDMPSRIFIAELVLKNGRRWRYIVPNGKVTEIGEEGIGAGSLVGREITITGSSVAWATGKTITSLDILESTETSGS